VEGFWFGFGLLETVPEAAAMNATASANRRRSWGGGIA